MKITIYGLGYVGLVSAACLAEVGHELLCVDIDESKVNQLCAGIIPIYEPKLDELIKSNTETGRLRFTTDIDLAVAHGEVQLIAVGTPSKPDGSVELNYLHTVVRNIASRMTSFKLIVNKSTVPVGTAHQVKKRVTEILQQRHQSIEFAVASNPEFLKEGDAINDFMHPDRIVIGTDCKKAETLLKQIYQPFNHNHERVLVMDIASAELTKYAANAMLATKISFINELANLAERLGADIEQVRLGIGSDPRIGYHFIHPGCGYGGSCFPKDMSALMHIAKEVKLETTLLQAVDRVNYQQKRVLFDKIRHHFKDELFGKTFALWGLAFKPNTDDVRDASSAVLVRALAEVGVSVQAYDPVAMLRFSQHYPELQNINFMSSMEETVQQADALIICTEWSNFRAPNFALVKKQLREPTIFDGRNLYDPQVLKQLGFTYYGIGRGEPITVRELAETALEVSLVDA